jgi:hypothetical protein
MNLTEAEGTRGSILNLGAMAFAMHKEGHLRSQRLYLIKERIVNGKLITGLAAMTAHLPLLFAPAYFVPVALVAAAAPLAIIEGAIITANLTPWPESASELYQPSDRRLSAKLGPTFCGLRVSCISRHEMEGSRLFIAL